VIRAHVVEQLLRIYAATAQQEPDTLVEEVTVRLLEQPTDEEVTEARRQFRELHPDQWAEVAERLRRDDPLPRPGLHLVEGSDDRP
jgi:hypothetical protein